MSKFLKIFGPAIGGTAVVLGGAYILADQFIADIPAPMRGQVVTAAQAQSSEPAAKPAAETAAKPAETAQSTPAPQAGQSMPTPAKFNIGRPATEDEIAAWDVNVMPNGDGLPEGSGSVTDGEKLFAENCAVCHGDFAEGSGNWPKLAGGDGSLADEDPVKTVGSYWPYLSTVWDYVHRSMPFGAAQTLSDDDTYAITAYILYSNFLVDEDFVLNRDNFLSVEMNNADGFIVDDRPETEYANWSGEPCMENCKDSVEITKRASTLNVTPENSGIPKIEAKADQAAPAQETASSGEAATDQAATDQAATAQAAAPAEDATATEAAQTPAEAVAAADPELIAKGEKVFRKCKACHEVGAGAKNKTGPQLNDIMGRTAGSVEDYKYSKAMRDAGAEGLVWNSETLAEFLRKPKAFLKGTKMSFGGLRKDSDLEAVEAYLANPGE